MDRVSSIVRGMANERLAAQLIGLLRLRNGRLGDGLLRTLAAAHIELAAVDLEEVEKAGSTIVVIGFRLPGRHHTRRVRGASRGSGRGWRRVASRLFGSGRAGGLKLLVVRSLRRVKGSRGAQVGQGRKGRTTGVHLVQVLEMLLDSRVTVGVKRLSVATGGALRMLALKLGEELVKRTLATRISTCTAAVASHDELVEVWLAPKRGEVTEGCGVVTNVELVCASGFWCVLAMDQSNWIEDSPAQLLG